MFKRFCPLLIWISDEPYDRDGEDDDEHDDEGWDYLGDGYDTLDERAELRDIVQREKQEMRDDADSSKLGEEFTGAFRIPRRVSSELFF